VGQVVAYASGCWDLFHFGHLRYLQRAKDLCDILVVGINTDEMIVSYKGMPPVVPYEQRWFIVESLDCVDIVVPHLSLEDTTGFAEHGVSIRIVGPEFGVVEGQRRMIQQHKEQGIRLITLSRTPNITTTIIKEAIRENKTVADYLISANLGSGRLPG